MILVSARAALLQALVAEEGHGLELIERIRMKTAGRVRLQQGSVYPALRLLEREGHVVSRREVREEGGRPRVIYTITTDGRKVARLDAKAISILFG